MQAQCGGGQNIARLDGRMDILAKSPKFAPFLASFPSPWLYQDAEAAAEFLQRAGFVDIQTNLEAAPTLFDDRQHYSEFMKTVIVRTYLDRCPMKTCANNTFPPWRTRPQPTILRSCSTTGGSISAQENYDF